MTRFRLVMSAALATWMLAGCDLFYAASLSASKPAFKNLNLSGQKKIHELGLPDVNGKMRQLSEFKGKVTVVFFGFTQCPDVCPTTLGELAQLKKTLGSEGQKLQVVFITLDPERDTADLLRAYVSGFDSDFVALRGSDQQIKRVAANFKMYYNKVPGQTDSSYTIDHTAGSYVIDQQGQLRLFVRYGSSTQDLIDDLKLLLREGGPSN
jgi:protein SCO1